MSMMDFAGALGGGMPPEGPPPAPAEGAAQEFENSLDALLAAEEALQAFIQLDPDDADRAIASKCLQEILKLKAVNQTDARDGGMKSFARAMQGAPLG